MADLHIEGLVKAFAGNPVLDGIDLDVPSGSLVSILGASGSGKTTLLRLLCGFEHADAGTIRIGGRIVADRTLHLPPEQRHIGYVAQEGALFPHLSVADNIVFGLPRRLRLARHRVAELLDLVGLQPAFANRLPQELSGGEQQRVALARALAPGAETGTSRRAVLRARRSTSHRNPPGRRCGAIHRRGDGAGGDT